MRYHERDRENCKGTFQFYGDGTLIFDSGRLGPGLDPVTFSLDITGVDELKIVLSALYQTSGWPAFGATGFYQIGDAFLN